MSNNVLKLSKQQAQSNSSHPSNLTPFSNSILQLQRHVSVENTKEKEAVSHLKDSHHHTTSSQQNIKKLAVLLDPHKDLYNSASSSYTSPKSFVGNSTKSTNIKASVSSLENSHLNLISPKDLVRLAMNKHQSKAVVKKLPAQSPSALSRNARKSVCLRSGESRPKKRDRSNSKVGSNSIFDEPSLLSKTVMPSNQEKSSKMKRMKLIYNDTSNSEIQRLAKSTVYTPQEASGRLWQGNLSPNRSNSGLLWPGSPNVNMSMSTLSNPKSKLATQAGKENEYVKTEGSHRKRGSVGHMGTYLKEWKPLKKQSKRSEKKVVQPRQSVSTESLKPTSVLYNKLLSHNVAAQEAIERAKSPTADLLIGEDEIDENKEILDISGYTQGIEIKPREEFITDLKNWVNDLVKPQEESEVIVPKKNPVVVERVKEVQEGLLSKLREALENDEFVRREDYERLYQEKDNIEEELDSVKEENAQLRAMLWRIQEENEARAQQESEERQAFNPHNGYNADLIQSLQETIAKQAMELEHCKRRENIVQDVLQMIWKAGIQIGGLQINNLMNQNPQMENEQLKNSYTAENGYCVSSFKQDSYTCDIPEQNDQSEATSRHPLALSEMEDSGIEPSNRQPLIAMAKSPHVPMNKMTKVQSNAKENHHSSSQFQAQPIMSQNYFPPRTQEKLKLDLSGLGGNSSKPKSNVFASHGSVPNISKPIMTEVGPPLGFHEEFMSKLEEFSLSWRQDALNYQKF